MTDIEKIQESIKDRIEKLEVDIAKGETLKMEKHWTDTDYKYRWVVMMKAEIDNLREIEKMLN